MGKQARDTVCKNFTVNKMIEHYQILFGLS